MGDYSLYTFARRRARPRALGSALPRDAAPGLARARRRGFTEFTPDYRAVSGAATYLRRLFRPRYVGVAA